jgi:DNA repair photolyase
MPLLPVETRNLTGGVIHDFPYRLPGRKCPHTGLVSLADAGGCAFACPMCYARAYPWSVSDRIVFHADAPQKLDRELSRARIVPPLHLSQVIDCLQPVPEVRALTKAAVAVIMRHQVSFSILTKSADGARELVRDLPDLLDYPFWRLALTIEAPPQKQSVTSPGASPIRARLETLADIAARGIAVGARTDPFVVGLIEPEEQLWLLDQIAQTGAKHVISAAGFFNHLSMNRLLEAIRGSRWPHLAERVAAAYGATPERLARGGRGRPFRLTQTQLVALHRWLRTETEARGMTYSVCLELPRAHDSPGLKHCEASSREHVHVRRDGRLHPLPCAGDCLRYCPNADDRPCGEPRMLTEYPLQRSTMGIPSPQRIGQPELFGQCRFSQSERGCESPRHSPAPSSPTPAGQH